MSKPKAKFPPKESGEKFDKEIGAELARMEKPTQPPRQLFLFELSTGYGDELKPKKRSKSNERYHPIG